MNDRPADQHRERMRQKSRENFASVADVGEIPKIKNRRRRKSCEFDLFKFLTTYFPDSTGLTPFSDDHKRAISRIESCVLKGGRFVEAVYRGFAKTTIAENTTIWATVYGHRKFVPAIASTKPLAKAIIDSIKMELSDNDLLAEDFPEVVIPIRALEGKSQRCKSQTHQLGLVEGSKAAGDPELTHIEWAADKIVLPYLKVPASFYGGRKKDLVPIQGAGAILGAYGIIAASRGIKHKRPDGVQQRPDFVFIDDPQTDVSAKTTQGVNKRLSIIKKNILRLGGHRKKMAVVIAATVIEPNDAVDQLLNPALNPSFQGERIAMIRQWSDRHADLWMQQYKDLRNGFDPNLIGDQAKAHKKATAFYVANRADMDRGCQVSWDQCYEEEEGEVSAIQHAYNILIDDGEEVFASECQNKPVVKEKKSIKVSAEAICKKINGLPIGTVPSYCTRLTSYFDVQGDLLYWVVSGWSDDMDGCVISYGAWPDQQRHYFLLSEARPTLKEKYPGMGLEASIFQGLVDLSTIVYGSQWNREGGGSLQVERGLVDAAWGISTATVKEFCRRTSFNILPSFGVGIKAGARGINEGKRKAGESRGLNWQIKPPEQGQRIVRYDTNFWKTFVHQRLATPKGDAGCLELCGADPSGHRMISDHLNGEYAGEVTRKGVTAIEWEDYPHKPDNHLGDCVVGSAVAASMCGAVLPSQQGANRPTKGPVKYSMSDRYKKRKGR